jgi:hypothetical protein
MTMEATNPPMNCVVDCEVSYGIQRSGSWCFLLVFLIGCA